MMFRIALADLNRLRGQIGVTQEQASTGNRINRPSDDPAGAGRILLLEGSRAALNQYKETISGTRARVSASENAVSNTISLLQRASSLAVQGANGTFEAGGRAQIATEVEGLFAAVLSEANTRFAGGHIFAGFSSDSAPFVSAGSFGAPPLAPVVSFAGDSNEIQVDIEDGVRVASSFDGRRIFQGDGDGDGSPDAGRDDVFAVLADLRTALVSDDPVAITATLPRIQTLLEQLQAERTGIGSVESRLFDAEDRIDSRLSQLEIHLSDVRDAPFEEVVSNLTRQETALRASLEVMSRLLPPSLMDFLR